MINSKQKLIVTFILSLMSFFTFSQPPGGGQGGRQGGNRPEQREKPNASKILAMLDTNDDNKIDRDEAANDKRGKISEGFSQIDSNEDGFIDLEELEASLNNRKPKRVSAKKMLKEIDDDGSGTLNELEVAAKKNRTLLVKFSEIDTNDDGELDIDELKAFYKKQGNKKRERRN